MAPDFKGMCFLLNKTRHCYAVVRTLKFIQDLVFPENHFKLANI